MKEIKGILILENEESNELMKLRFRIGPRGFGIIRPLITEDIEELEAIYVPDGVQYDLFKKA